MDTRRCETGRVCSAAWSLRSGQCLWILDEKRTESEDSDCTFISWFSVLFWQLSTDSDLCLRRGWMSRTIDSIFLLPVSRGWFTLTCSIKRFGGHCSSTWPRTLARSANQNLRDRISVLRGKCFFVENLPPFSQKTFLDTDDRIDQSDTRLSLRRAGIRLQLDVARFAFFFRLWNSKSQTSPWLSVSRSFLIKDSPVTKDSEQQNFPLALRWF